MSRFVRFLLAAVVVSTFATTASAAPIVTAQSANPTSFVTTGTFDVTITVPLGDAPIQLGVFDITVTVSGGAQFTGADFPASNYVFAGASFFQDSAQPLSPSVFPGTDAELNDLSSAPNSFVTINPGQTFTLGTISFSTPPFSGAAGGDVYQLSVSGMLNDGLGNNIAFDSVAGAITVIPEPVTLAVFGGLAATAFVVRRRRQIAVV